MRERVAMIRSLEAGIRPPIGILARPAGPEAAHRQIRRRAAISKIGDPFTLDADPTPGDAPRVHLPHPEILRALRPAMPC
jgi:pyruvate kinase